MDSKVFIPDKKWQDKRKSKELISLVPCCICRKLVIIRGGYPGSFVHNECYQKSLPFKMIEIKELDGD